MPKVTFRKNGQFYTTLKLRVDEYFTSRNLKKTGNWKLYLKTFLFISAAVSIYIVLLTVSLPVVPSLLLCAFLGTVLAGVGFSIMHDAVHGSYSSKDWINSVLSLTLNTLGGNVLFYKRRHLIHHNYTNVDGIDDDIAKSPLLRQCVSQKWFPAHRYQHIYIVLVYAISGLAWITILDFKKYLSGKIHVTPMHRLTPADHIIFWLTKILYVVFYIVLPIYFTSGQQWITGYLCMNFAMGLTLAFVFQPAHVVEATEFEWVGEENKTIETEWAVHQVKTSANYAITNPFVNWYTGGLNFQIEHHLFPKISHVYYPAISKIVQQTCAEFDLPYNSYPTFTAAIISHIRVMKQLGHSPSLEMAKVYSS